MCLCIALCLLYLLREGTALENSVAAGVRGLATLTLTRICLCWQTLKRTGWVNNKVALPESVADHMYRMSMCCMLLDDANETVNRPKYVIGDCRSSLAIRLHSKEEAAVLSCLACVTVVRCIKMAIVHDLAESLVVTSHLTTVGRCGYWGGRWIWV